MPYRAPDFPRLSLEIERLMDAELLLAEEGGRLLAEIAAAHRSLAENDFEAVQQHTAQFVQSLEALVRTDRLNAGAEPAALEMARQILTDSTLRKTP